MDTQSPAYPPPPESPTDGHHNAGASAEPIAEQPSSPDGKSTPLFIISGSQPTVSPKQDDAETPDGRAIVIHETPVPADSVEPESWSAGRNERLCRPMLSFMLPTNLPPSPARSVTFTPLRRPISPPPHPLRRFKLKLTDTMFNMTSKLKQKPRQRQETLEDGPGIELGTGQGAFFDRRNGHRRFRQVKKAFANWPEWLPWCIYLVVLIGLFAGCFWCVRWVHS